MLDGVRRVVIVPGYGLAVAQAQHAVRDLFNQLESAAPRSSSRFIRWPAACRGT